MPWASPSSPRDNSKIDAVNKKSAETTIRRYKEKGETRYIVRNVGTGQEEIKQLCEVMNSIEDIINMEGKTVSEKVYSIKRKVECALSTNFKTNKQSQCYVDAKNVFDTMKQYFNRIYSALNSNAEHTTKLKFAKNVYSQFDDRYGKLFED